MSPKGHQAAAAAPLPDEEIESLLSISQRRKLWKLVSKGIEVQAVARKSDKIYTIVRVIETNCEEMSENYSFSCPNALVGPR